MIETHGPAGVRPVEAVPPTPSISWAGFVLQILLWIALPLGLSAPFGTTILGTVAIGNIRHSRGMLYGLPLAVADALFFPLLFLDGLLLWLAVMLSLVLGGTLHMTGVPGWFFVVVTIPPVLLLDALIAWAVWRHSSSPMVIAK